MTRVAIWNLGALAVAISLSAATVSAPALRVRSQATSQTDDLGTSAPFVVDHSGRRLAADHYTRIASLSTVADELLLELCEPDRIVAVTGYSARGANGYRFAGKPVLEGEHDLERLLALRPDLVLVNRIGDARPIARMREAGLKVYDLGEMRGMTTLVPNIREVAAIVGHPERGAALAQSLTNRMRTIAADLPQPIRKRGVYLAVYGGHIYGGALGTSYHDVLTAAGLVDATERYRDWPEYSVEQLLALDPEVVVTNEGMKPRICEHVGLSSLRACRGHGVLAEIDPNLLGDPGPSMADAADAVREAIYGPPEARLAASRGTP